MDFQHFRFAAPRSHHIYTSDLLFKASLPFKNAYKTIGFSTFPFSWPIQPAHVDITFVIGSLCCPFSSFQKCLKQQIDFQYFRLAAPPSRTHSHHICFLKGRASRGEHDMAQHVTTTARSQQRKRFTDELYSQTCLKTLFPITVLLCLAMRSSMD